MFVSGMLLSVFGDITHIIRARIRFGILFAFSAVLLAGCAVKNDVLLPDEKASLNASRVTIIARPKPHFQQSTKSDAWLTMATFPLGAPVYLGAIGVLSAADVVQSDSFIEKHQLVDPAYQIAVEIGEYFSEHYGVQSVGLKKEVTTTSDINVLSASLNETADFALDVETVYWGLLAGTVSDYVFIYSASFYLINLHEAEILASGDCVYTSETARPNYVDFTENNAAELKSEIRTAEQECARLFVDIILDERPNDSSSWLN